MTIEKWLILIFTAALLFYFWKRYHLSLIPQKSISAKVRFAEFWRVLEVSIAAYRKEMLPYVIYQEIVLERYPRHILPALEECYGRSGGCPYLSLPQEWRVQSAEGIPLWMQSKNMLYSANLPALHQLENLIKKEVEAEAKQILDKAIA